MFCPKCGGTVTEGVAFCPGCGAPTTAASAQKAPLIETKVVQIYPDSDLEADTISLYQKCGWTVVSSERQQERSGNTISTFIRITFQRDKNMPNYSEIKRISDEVMSIAGTRPKQESTDGAKYIIAAGLFLITLPFILIIGLVKYNKIKKRNKKAIEAHAQSVKHAHALAAECEKLLHA